MDRKYKIEKAGDPQPTIHFLEDKIYEHNSSTINKTGGTHFSFDVKNSENEIIAGIAGWTWAGASEITLLWVNQEWRKKGIGKLLLKAAEEEARNKDCAVMLVKSYSFQAPQFYEQHGFVIRHVLENFPEGFHYYTLTKRLEISQSRQSNKYIFTLI